MACTDPAHSGGRRALARLHLCISEASFLSSHSIHCSFLHSTQHSLFIMAESGSRKRSRFDRAGDDASPRHDRRRSRSPHGDLPSSSGAGQATKRERSPLINPLRRHMNRDRSDKSDSRPTSAGKADAKADDRPVSRGSDSAREKAAIAAAKAAELNATLMAKIKSGVSSSAPVIRPVSLINPLLPSHLTLHRTDGNYPDRCFSR